jgi:SAM-dependent methyltransferase
MGTKHDLLTERDVESYSPRSRALAELDGCVRRFGVAVRGLRVLDFGCGRGITVAKLLEMGFDAYGVDTDPEPITNGSRLFIACGYNPDQRLIRIDTDRLMPFQDGFFHVVLSNQVIEHVRNLDFLAAELARVTAPSGRGLHVFPAKWCIFEPHLFLPCIHWLPKNSLRFLYLRLMLKYVPFWQELEHKTSADRAFTYYTYSIQKTYYRRHG